MADFIYEKPFQMDRDSTSYRLLTKKYVKVIEEGGRKILKAVSYTHLTLPTNREV